MPSRERGRRLERSETGVNLGDAHFASIFRASTRDLRIVIVTKNQLPNVLMRTFDQISEIKHSHENVWQLIFWCEGLRGRPRGAPFTPCRITLVWRMMLQEQIMVQSIVVMIHELNVQIHTISCHATLSTTITTNTIRELE